MHGNGQQDGSGQDRLPIASRDAQVLAVITALGEDGRYPQACNQLEDAGIFLDEDEFQRVRREVFAGGLAARRRELLRPGRPETSAPAPVPRETPESVQAAKLKQIGQVRDLMQRLGDGHTYEQYCAAAPPELQRSRNSWKPQYKKLFGQAPPAGRSGPRSSRAEQPPPTAAPEKTSQAQALARARAPRLKEILRELGPGATWPQFRAAALKEGLPEPRQASFYAWARQLFGDGDKVQAPAPAVNPAAAVPIGDIVFTVAHLQQLEAVVAAKRSCGGWLGLRRLIDTLERAEDHHG
jgi:hypothetical protein